MTRDMFPSTRVLSTADLGDDDIAILKTIIEQHRQIPSAISRREALRPYTAPEMYEKLTPTSELLNRAANMLRDLMIGRGVDRRNGLDWEGFVRQLFDRAAAFKAIEDGT